MRESNLQMTIKVNHRNRSIRFIQTAQQRQGDGMVTAHGDNARKRLSGP